MPTEQNNRASAASAPVTLSAYIVAQRLTDFGVSVTNDETIRMGDLVAKTTTATRLIRIKFCTKMISTIPRLPANYDLLAIVMLPEFNRWQCVCGPLIYLLHRCELMELRRKKENLASNYSTQNRFTPYYLTKNQVEKVLGATY